jgi:hypothetical protein
MIMAETAAGIFQLILWELFIPTVVGIFFTGVDTKVKKLPLMWISGQMLMWALFQIISVGFILKEVDFSYLVICYAAVTGLLLAAACIYYVNRRKAASAIRPAEAANGGDIPAYTKICLTIFVLLLLFQLVMAVVMTYSDGDDAYYVAVSTITSNAETMYRKLPYTGGATELDARHGLAPFPIWVSFLSAVSGIKSVATAHVAMPLAMIAMTYGVFYLVGSRLLSSDKVPVFLVFTQILVLFGNYSYYTAENFLIARSRQGKSALANIIIPLIIWVCLLIMDKLKSDNPVGMTVWLLFLSVQTAACLCSTQGGMISSMMTAAAALCMALSYKKWRFMIPMAICCTPCVVYAAMYMLFR